MTEPMVLLHGKARLGKRTERSCVAVALAGLFAVAALRQGDPDNGLRWTHPHGRIDFIVDLDTPAPMCPAP